MEVSASVRAVQVPDDNPMHPQMTTMYVVGKDQVLTIDSGEDMDRYRWMLRGYLAATERAEIALAGITHHHFDHSANLKWIREIYGADILIHEEGKPILEDRLPDSGVNLMRDGHVIDLGGGTRVRVLHTPGHSVDSVCYYLEDEGVLFSGDTILGQGTATMRDLFDYMNSLERLAELPHLKVMCPGHGPLIWDPRERIQEYIDHRNQRERQIVAVLGEGGEMTSWDIMMKIYTDVDARLRRAADGNVQTHLRKLDRDGRLKVYEGKPKETSPEDQARQEEEVRAAAELQAKAQEAATRARRQAGNAQENPQAAQWDVPTKYELVGSASD